MGIINFSYANEYSYARPSSYASSLSYANSLAASGYGGQGANPILADALLSTRENLLACLSVQERADLLALAGKGSTRWPPGDEVDLPVPDQAALSDRYADDARASLIQFELLGHADVAVEGTSATLRIYRSPTSSPTKIVTLSRPSRERFHAELERVQALAPLRAGRLPEILAQVIPPTPFFASVLNLQTGRHAKTMELLQAALQFAFVVGMRFKHAFAAPRPGEYTGLIQPVIEVPKHPSYPAGHAIESHLTAGLLTALTEAPPQQAKLLRQLATRISENRVIAGVHFPIDCKAGRLIGDALASYLVAVCQDDGHGHSVDGWRVGSQFDMPETSAKLDYASSLQPFEDCRTDPGQGASGQHLLPDLPVLRRLWAQARSEWTWPQSPAAASEPLLAFPPGPARSSSAPHRQQARTARHSGGAGGAKPAAEQP